MSSPTWLAAALADPTLNQQPVGTGPFVFDSRSPDSVTRFVRNEDWWNGEVFLDAVEFVPVPDAATRAELLRRGRPQRAADVRPGAILIARRGPEHPAGHGRDRRRELRHDQLGVRRRSTTSAPARHSRWRHPIENYLNLIGLGDAAPRDAAVHPGEPVLQPGRHAGDGQPGRGEGTVRRRTARDFPENCTDGKINMELQYPAGSVVLDQTGRPLIQGWGDSFNVEIQTLPQDEHIQEAALGQYNTVLWRQFGAEDPALDNVWLLCRTVGGISLNFAEVCAIRPVTSCCSPPRRPPTRPSAPSCTSRSAR